MKLASVLAQQTSSGDWLTARSYLCAWYPVRTDLAQEKSAPPPKLLHKWEEPVEERRDTTWLKRGRTVTNKNGSSLPRPGGRSTRPQSLALASGNSLASAQCCGPYWKRFTSGGNHMVCQTVHILVFETGLHHTHPSLSPDLVNGSLLL